MLGNSIHGKSFIPAIWVDSLKLAQQFGVFLFFQACICFGQSFPRSSTSILMNFSFSCILNEVLNRVNMSTLDMSVGHPTICAQRFLVCLTFLRLLSTTVTKISSKPFWHEIKQVKERLLFRISGKLTSSVSFIFLFTHIIF